MKEKIVVAILLIIILICSSVLYLIVISLPNKDKKVEPQSEFDDGISPLTTQALFFEINRIRRKGIIEHMYHAGWDVFDVSPRNGGVYPIIKELPIILDGIRLGIGWDEKPNFRWEINIQNSSQSVCTFKSKIVYSTWDTDYVNQEIFTPVEEEQLKSEVTLTFFVKKKEFLSQKWIESESINLIYHFRTGQWIGDDYFNDTDGYGHFDGCDFEIWFDVKQTDYDGDGIPYWTEVHKLHTNPKIDDSKLDPDKDGIPTTWEWKWGYNHTNWDNHSYLDPDNDGLQNNEEYFMEKWLANPYYPDIFIEVDYTKKAPFKLFNKDLNGEEHIFWKESQQLLIERFNEHGITVHIDDGIMGEGGEFLPFETGSGMYQQEQGVISEYYSNHFSDERKGIFRYIVVAHGGGWCYPQDYKNWYDCMCVPSRLQFFNKQLGCALTPRTMRIGRAVSVMHELGHSCGFTGAYHGGVDKSVTYIEDPKDREDYKWWDYQSVMSYDYFRQRLLDYSDGTHGENDKDDWGNIDLTFFQRPSIYIEGVCPP